MKEAIIDILSNRFFFKSTFLKPLIQQQNKDVPGQFYHISNFLVKEAIDPYFFTYFHVWFS